MADFAIGDLVRVKGCAMVMCVEDVDPLTGDGVQWVRTVWFDYVGQAHRDGFDPRCLERVQAYLGTIVERGTQVPHHGTIS